MQKQNYEEKERIIVSNEKLGKAKNENELLLQATIDQLRISLSIAQQEKEEVCAKEYLLRVSFNKTYVILSEELHVPLQNLNDGNLKAYMHSWKANYIKIQSISVSGGWDGNVNNERSVRSTVSTKIYSSTTSTSTQVISSVNDEINKFEYESKNNGRNKEIEHEEDDEKYFISFELFSRKISFGYFGNEETAEKIKENERNEDIFTIIDGKDEIEEEKSILLLIAKDF